MGFQLTSLDPLADAGFDEIIDVRSPSEHAEDHIPGAVNLPVLDDAERAQVGTIYVQESRFLARRIGAALVARNVARHLERYLAGKGPKYRPLVYCWRGGQRSGAFASILGQIGWQVAVVEGGYRSWRRLVWERLYAQPLDLPIVLLDGNTGTAKTELLHLLAVRGVQIVDLEGLAQHRGSVFGAEFGEKGQPSQKRFESALATRMAGLDPARVVVMEAESAKIGNLRVPPSVWRAMQDSPRIVISAPVAARAAFLLRAYADVTSDRAALEQAIDGLRPFHPRERVENWLAQAAGGDFEALAVELMAHHYDPRYARSNMRRRTQMQSCVAAESLDAPDLGRMADEICALLPDKTGAARVS